MAQATRRGSSNRPAASGRRPAGARGAGLRYIETVAPRLDSDTHLYESRDLWARFADPRERDRAISIVDDDLGHSWLTAPDGRRISLAEVHVPGDVDAVGAYRRSVRDGQPAEASFDELLLPEFVDPSARLGQLDEWGLDGSVVFPNFGLLWERPLSGDLETLKVNMGSWNRWAAEVAQQGGGRLFPVAHLTLRDAEWLDQQLAALQAGGVKLAMIAPALVDGKPLSHPDLDRVWSAFVEHGVTPVFHVANQALVFDDAWFEPDDPLEVGPVFQSVFIWTAPALAVADMAVNGVFARHPELRLGIMELSAPWVPMFLMYLDGGLDFTSRFDGMARRPQLEMKPSEYVTRQVRVAAFPYENPAKLIHQVGEEMFMYCSDWPHAEGLARPVVDYDQQAGVIEGVAGQRLYAGNLESLLNR